MDENKVVRFYLSEKHRKSVVEGKQNFISKFAAVLETENFSVDFCDNSLSEQVQSMTRKGHAVFYMKEPTNRNGVTIRPNYFYPFWNIETTANRWQWSTAEDKFDARCIPKDEATSCANFLRQKQFGDKARNISHQGLVYVPLQGRLLSQRSFQSCDPITMIKQVLEFDKTREVVATLHPKETYSIEELNALSDLEAHHFRLTVSKGNMEIWLQGCDYVATQNSAAAFSGYFFKKPAVLFGRVNFHHIAANVHELGPEAAINQVANLNPDFDAYIWWFLRHKSIHASKPDAEDRIRNAIRRVGWI
ncbi:MAG: hypothetical protein P8Q99_12820 [Paracoccaceae bacterium]|nr:hypothetical protein [Paracoccaceae bacterium]